MTNTADIFTPDFVF